MQNYRCCLYLLNRSFQTVRFFSQKRMGKGRCKETSVKDVWCNVGNCSSPNLIQICLDTVIFRFSGNNTFFASHQNLKKRCSLWLHNLEKSCFFEISSVSKSNGLHFHKYNVNHWLCIEWMMCLLVWWIEKLWFLHWHFTCYYQPNSYFWLVIS